MFSVRTGHLAVVGFVMLTFGSGCAGMQVPLPKAFPATSTVVFGKVLVNLSGPTNRWFVPEIEFAELYNRDLNERIRINFKAQQSLFVLPLPEGHYDLIRVQIAEGAFRSMAQLPLSFQVQNDRITYVGTWTFEVAPPYYDRAITLTVSSELTNAVAEMHRKYPGYQDYLVRNALPIPASQETRLYEVMPYPRVKYFRRHPAT